MDATSTIDRTAADDLDAAATVYDAKEWLADRFTSHDWTRCCPIAAIVYSIHGSFDPHVDVMASERVWAAEGLLTEYLREYGLGADTIDWNDNACQGKADAQRMMRAAAAWWRTQASA